jgi:hypothetical protein
MLEPEDLNELHEMMPMTAAVRVYARSRDSVLATTGVIVGTAEKRPVNTSEQQMINKISGDLDRCTFHLWTMTFASPLKIQGEYVIEQADGSRWAIVAADLELAGARWRCPCIEYIGRSVN